MILEPPFIYKYFSINTNFYNSIINNCLWFSDPAIFNDPYDCNINIDITKYSREELFDFYSELQRIHIKSGNLYAINVDINKRVNEVIQNPELLENDFINIIDFGICCFSKKDDNILMWSHYADKHKGICLKFDIRKDPVFFNIPFEVNYQNDYPDINYLEIIKNNGKGIAQNLLATKSIDWLYEEEIRIIKDSPYYKNHRGNIKFLKESLIEVIFGYKVKEQINIVKSLFNKFGYKCHFSQVRIKKKEFGLEKFEV